MIRSIVEAVYEHALRTPDRLCIADEKAAYSYAEIWEKTVSYADWFGREGIRRGESIVAECTQDASFLVCALACQLSGVIFVPVEYRPAAEKVRAVTEDVEAKLFLCASEAECACPEADMARVREGSVSRVDKGMESFRFPESGDVAEILYTTGTTGKSKGIVISHKNNIAVAENIQYGTQMGRENVELIPLPLSHSHGLRTCYANLLNGSSIVLINGVMNIKKLFELIDSHKVTALDLSPSAVKVLLKLAQKHLKDYRDQIDYIEIGTAVLEEEVKEGLCQTFPKSRLYNFYGSTESGRSCIFDFNAERGKKGCIGMPTKNAVFIVTDEDRRPIVSGESEMGLLAIAGAMNMVGYYKEPELTEETLQNGYIYTNDVGYISESGAIYLFGRKGNIINYRGIKIAPEEIEEAAMRFEALADCACVPQKDAIGGEVPKLFVVIREDREFEKQQFLDFLAQHLEQNKMPRIIERIDAVPRAGNGKILRNLLMNGKDGN